MPVCTSRASHVSQIAGGGPASPAEHAVTGAALVLTLALALGATATACSNSVSTTPPSATVTSTTRVDAARQARLALAVSCLRAHGMAIATGSTAKEIRKAFKSLPIVSQLSDFAACATFLPAKVREKVRAYITAEESAASTTTSSA